MTLVAQLGVLSQTRTCQKTCDREPRGLAAATEPARIGPELILPEPKIGRSDLETGHGR